MCLNTTPCDRRKLKLNNKKVQQAVVNVDGGLELLQASGFELVFDESSPEPQAAAAAVPAMSSQSQGSDAEGLAQSGSQSQGSNANGLAQSGSQSQGSNANGLAQSGSRSQSSHAEGLAQSGSQSSSGPPFGDSVLKGTPNAEASEQGQVAPTMAEVSSCQHITSIFLVKQIYVPSCIVSCRSRVVDCCLKRGVASLSCSALYHT